MTAGSAAGEHWKAAKKYLCIFRSGFNPSKCKTMAKMAVARVKLLRNKREATIKQMRRDVAMLLESGQDSIARIRVEHVIREQNILTANELIELFCELIVSRLSIIAKQRECPSDLKEGITSLLFAGPRCSELPELLSIRDIFQKKYGKDFVSAATDLRPNAGVNRMLIEKLSVKSPSGEIKLKVLKEIAKEYHIQWDTAESEEELLKPPEERIEGPNNFASATSLPMKPVQVVSPQLNNGYNRGQSNIATDFQDLPSAAHLASYGDRRTSTPPRQGVNNVKSGGKPNGSESSYSNGDRPEQQMSYYEGRRVGRRQSYDCPREHTGIKFDESDYDEELEMEEPPRAAAPPRAADMRKMNRRDTYGPDSDDDYGEEEKHQPTGGAAHRPPPDRPAPQVPLHPKLPDYDTLAARFEALKHHRA